MHSRVSHWRSESVIGEGEDVLSELVGTVVHEATVESTAAYLVIWSGVRVDEVGGLEVLVGCRKGSRSIP